MSNLIVSFDPGASLTKIVYELATEGKPCLMTMEPEMLKLPQSSIDAYMLRLAIINALARKQGNFWLTLFANRKALRLRLRFLATFGDLGWGKAEGRGQNILSVASVQVQLNVKWASHLHSHIK